MFGLEVLFIGRAEQQVFQSGAVEDDNLRALFGQVAGDVLPQDAAAACNDGHLSFDVE